MPTCKVSSCLGMWWWWWSLSESCDYWKLVIEWMWSIRTKNVHKTAGLLQWHLCEVWSVKSKRTGNLVHAFLKPHTRWFTC